MSVEVRRMTSGTCRCPGPYNPGEEPTCEHWWECDYGHIPSFDIDDPAPLIITGRDWAHQVLASGGTRRNVARRIGRTDTIYVVPALNTDGETLRMFHRIEYRGRSWTWELEPAHWNEKLSRSNNARLSIYVGRWPD